MPKLHEVLAVEGDLEGVYKKIVDETAKVFTKGEHFTGFHKTLAMYDDSRKMEEAPAEEYKELPTTVPRKLNYALEHVTRYLDCVLQKELTNQNARADLVVDGMVLATELPATFLLGLENKLKFIRTMYDTIPTLPPGIKWEKDATRGDDVYVTARPEMAKKTEKVIQHKILVQPTDKHPAQIEKWTEDVPVGNFSVTKWNGMISPREKHELLERLDNLIRAVKEARQRANCAEVVKQHVAAAFFDYIQNG